ncbi:hypothetical protein AAFF_G00161390 [Aldrovandia affinis]|uniref:Uncharacterized protein n=1 Tax=Aldrovandia affinis TaxID=143900 RepID=A0AAD7RN18_9TELE|nr:hypothetical protein AAFF_G00161390 [Aldrovandia affinis]
MCIQLQRAFGNNVGAEVWRSLHLGRRWAQRGSDWLSRRLGNPCLGLACPIRSPRSRGTRDGPRLGAGLPRGRPQRAGGIAGQSETRGFHALRAAVSSSALPRPNPSDDRTLQPRAFLKMYECVSVRVHCAPCLSVGPVSSRSEPGRRLTAPLFSAVVLRRLRLTPTRILPAVCALSAAERSVIRRNPFAAEACCPKGSHNALQELYNPTQTQSRRASLPPSLPPSRPGDTEVGWMLIEFAVSVSVGKSPATRTEKGSSAVTA